ncbi:MAG: hypothetical protein FWF91_07775 [Coriobacteriia bacterium]|nr:hypothetical protein [Coriobacteriia bacterium]
MVLDGLIIGGSMISRNREGGGSSVAGKETQSGGSSQGGSSQGGTSQGGATQGGSSQGSAGTGQGNTSGTTGGNTGGTTGGNTGGTTGGTTGGNTGGSATGNTNTGPERVFNPYVNDPIGISMSIPDEWSAADSEGLPDEILRMRYEEYEGTSIWIDRYPSARLTDYVSRNEMFLPYERGLVGTVTDIELQETVGINDKSWERYAVILNASGEIYYIDLFLTDAPNNRGVVSYATVISLTGAGGTDLPGYEDAILMLQTLDFTR